MRVTYFGTTTLLFDDGKDQVLFDCHVTRLSFLRAFFTPLQTNAELSDKVIEDFKIDRLKAIFISHTHYDHVLDAPYFAVKCEADIYGSPSAINVALGGGVLQERLHSFEAQKIFCVGDFRITAIPSVHSIAHFYNDDLGKTIDKPLSQPAKKKEYKEGGSFDFYVEHSGKSYLIRPSYNFLVGQLDGLKADALFLGTAGLSSDTKKRRKRFFEETVEKTNPELIIPVHWDNFFTPLYDEKNRLKVLPRHAKKSVAILQRYCVEHNKEFLWQMPLSVIEL